MSLVLHSLDMRGGKEREGGRGEGNIGFGREEGRGAGEEEEDDSISCLVIYKKTFCMLLKDVGLFLYPRDACV